MTKVFKTRREAEEAAKQESDGLLGSKGFSCVAKKDLGGWVVQIFDEFNRGRFAGHLSDGVRIDGGFCFHLEQPIIRTSLIN